MQNVKLRLDYFLSLGLKLVVGDLYFNCISQKCTVNESVVKDLNNQIHGNTTNIFIDSFAPRENTGVRPCGGKTPVIVLLENGKEHAHPAAAKNWGFCWSDYGNEVKSWKPCIESLIKLQIEHDRKLALTAECEKITAAASQKQGDKRRIEFMSNHTGQLEIHDVTYQFETDKEICCIAEDGLILTVDKEEFVAWHDAVDELEVAKKKQIGDVLNAVNHTEYLISRESVRLIQDAGMLAEILPPLKN